MHMRTAQQLPMRKQTHSSKAMGARCVRAVKTSVCVEAEPFTRMHHPPGMLPRACGARLTLATTVGLHEPAAEGEQATSSTPVPRGMGCGEPAYLRPPPRQHCELTMNGIPTEENFTTRWLGWEGCASSALRGRALHHQQAPAPPTQE